MAKKKKKSTAKPKGTGRRQKTYPSTVGKNKHKKKR